MGRDRKVFTVIFDWIDGKLQATIIQIGENNMIMNTLGYTSSADLLKNLTLENLEGDHE